MFFLAMKGEWIRNVGNAREENFHKGHDEKLRFNHFMGTYKSNTSTL